MSGHVDAESRRCMPRGSSAVAGPHGSAPTCPAARSAPAPPPLTEVTTRLSQVPVPPIPSVVAARLDAALSAESAHRAAAPDAAPAPALAPACPTRGRPGATRCGPRAGCASWPRPARLWWWRAASATC